MKTSGHNYVATSNPEKSDAVISHNSHATAYGMIAYWSMYLKQFYTIEFYWSLLKNEPNRIRIQQIAKDAKAADVKLLPPSVNTSKSEFSIDRNVNAIRGSLVDIKSVGVAAAKTIIENQPYKDFFDFVERIDRRKCHKGAVVALAKSGALDDLLPNVKWFVENADKIWPLYNKKPKQFKEEISKSKNLPDYSPEEKTLLSSKVNPLAFGKHPIDAYGDFIKKNLEIKTISMGDDDFYKNNDGKIIYIIGVIVEVKYNQIGDFHTGELPPEEERERMNWGARYANVNIEDLSGKQNRVKFDIDIFDNMRPIIDSGIGTPVVVCCNVNFRFSSIRARYAVDLENLRKKIEDNSSDFNLWEKLIIGKHPVLDVEWKNSEVYRNRVHNIKFEESEYGGTYCGVVNSIKIKIDKNGNEMAFISMCGYDLDLDFVCFYRSWYSLKKEIEVKDLICIALEKQIKRKSVSYFYNGGGVKKIK